MLLVFLKRVHNTYATKNDGNNLNKSTKTLMVKVHVYIFFHTKINIISVNLYFIYKVIFNKKLSEYTLVAETTKYI